MPSEALPPRSVNTVSIYDEEDPEVILLDALYDTTLAAAKLHTVNEKFLEAFIYARNQSTQGAIATAVGVGAGMLAFDAAVVTTSAVAVMPLAEWEVAWFVGFGLTGEILFVFVSTTLWCPPLFLPSLAATVISAGNGIKRVLDIKKFNEKAN